MKPIIGVTMDFHADTKKGLINMSYVKAIQIAGGIPLCIPVGVEGDSLELLQVIDGLLLTGGGDLHPFVFGEEPHIHSGEIILERDQLELELVKQAIDQQIPILGICRGHQVLNVALGGTIYQDIYTQCQDDAVLLHSQKAARKVPTHYVNIDRTSTLFSIIGTEKIAVNSFHHQAIKDVAPSLKEVAIASDGVNEALEKLDYPFCLSVQWHPEEMAVAGDHKSIKLFTALIEAALANKICKGK